jgi:UDP-2-acetamido-2-deoxy-ribo-hexuluronate aminotransferase
MSSESVQRKISEHQKVPMTIEFIDLKAQYAALRSSINARIQTVLDHGQYIMGPEVQELEQRLAEYTGAKYCITCASGTDALLIALMALDIKPGDEVITSAFSFIAAAEMIALLGAKPVFVDIQTDTFNIDPNKIEEAITENTKAIIPISLFGQPADMDEINAIATNHGLAVIEDAAQSFGAVYKGQKSCNLSTIGCTSFFPSKPLGCYGDGGAIFTSDENLAKAMQEIRVHGQSSRYHHVRIGLGGRMDTIQCAVVLAKLERFDWEIRQRQAVAANYAELLSPLAEKIQLPVVGRDRTSVFAQYTVKVEKRDLLQEALSENGIPTAIHYPLPVHKQPPYTRFALSAETEISEAAAAKVLSLPMHPYLGSETLKAITARFGEGIKKVFI